MGLVSYGMTWGSYWGSGLLAWPGRSIAGSSVTTLVRDAVVWMGGDVLLGLWVFPPPVGVAVVWLGGELSLGACVCSTLGSGAIGFFASGGVSMLNMATSWCNAAVCLSLRCVIRLVGVDCSRTLVRPTASFVAMFSGKVLVVLLWSKKNSDV